MKTIINGNHLEVTDSMRGNIEAKVGHLLSNCNNMVTSSRVQIEKEKTEFKVTLIIRIIHYEVVSSSKNAEFYLAFDNAAEKAEAQLIKIMSKMKDHHATPLRDAVEQITV